MRLALPSTFRWGPRLRTLQSTRVAFPSFPQLLSASHDLVDLQLHEIPSDGHFSPEAFTHALSGMSQLRTLSLCFLSLPPRRNYLILPPPSEERVALPALTSLKYRGTSKYLDSLVARIDAPGLGDIDVTLFSQPTMDASQLGRFIHRTEMQASLNQAEVQISGCAISISFTGSSTSTPLRLQISCKQLDWQLSSMAQICNQFSPFLFRVKTLGINTTEPPSGQDDVGGEQWLGLFRSFGNSKYFRVGGVHVSDILYALHSTDGGRTSDGHATDGDTPDTIVPVLPALRILRVRPIDGPFWGVAQEFLTSRRFSGRPVALQLLCYICDASFTWKKSLKTHLMVMHAYRLMCSFCGDFECTPGHRHLFQEHLKTKHPQAEVARGDALISKPHLTPLELSQLVKRYSSLRVPVTGRSSTTVTSPRLQ
ncbi:hypothetical protein EDB87DRAFT_1619400 [Lactarius vividus]|nr:hypothetical protein EDB87DRAFT_1619400 [Lactarius vividus]